ncbi:gephyrin-like molybdotransferase Glp [Mesorhizobium sp. WSM2239]|uniref:Molybdopterin molybdenumtransferase n=2 Tax=unclassified Mesorhizobium TaxID=325217 RepID=A0AAU8DFG3_9HYPH
MAQLSDDCFAFGGPMRSVDDTAALIASRLSAVEESETVPLAIADGRILAKDLVAPLPLPPFTNSAVDGYALHGDDLPETAEKAFPVVDRIQAGMAPGRPVAPGQAIRIFTGAPLPDGVDTVYMQEDVRVDEAGRVILPPGLKRGANVRPAGEDVAEGKVVLQAGQRMRPQDVALAAALGMTEVEVRRKIRVAVFSTGDEIVAPGNVRGPAQLFDSNRFMLMAMLARLGCDITDLGILTDDGGLIADALGDAASRHDLILASGGVSTGEADYVKAAVESVGTLVFWRVAIKPGRPVAMGVIRGTAFIGLPGNPVASFVTFAHIARAAIFALAGARLQPPVSRPLRAAFSYRKKAGRREYVRVSLHRTDDGSYEAVKFPREGAGLLSSLVETDGLVELGEDVTQIEPGQTVQFLAYSDLN